MSVTGCSLDGQAQNNNFSAQNERFSSKVSEHTYKVLMGEFYFKQLKHGLAAEYFLDVALESDDPVIAERATKTAVFAGNVEKALIAARRWRALDGESSKAQQYITLLLLHKENYSEAADELNQLEKQIDRDVEKSASKTKKQSSRRKGDVMIVEMLKRDNNPAKVYETYKIFVERYSNTAETQFTLAEFAMADNRYNEALNAAELASQSDDKVIHRKAKLIYINALSELDRREEAAAELSQLIDNSADDRTKQIYARLLASLGKQDKAIDVLSSVYTNNSNNVSALRDMIALHIDQGNLDEGERFTRLLLKNKSQKVTAHYFLGRIYESKEQVQDAVKHYFKALDTRTFYMDVRGRIVSLLDRAGNVNEAIAFLHSEQKKSVDKRDLAYLYQMESSLLERSNKLKDALGVIKKASDLLPGYSPELQYSSALLYERLGEFGEAERVLKTVIEHDENNSAALNALGYMLVENTSRMDEALTYIEKAYEIKPDDPAIIDSLGWVHYHQGNYDKAEEYLRTAYRDLKDPEVAKHLIEVLTKKGNYTEAKTIYSEMISQHPENAALKKVKDKIIGMHE